MALAGGGAFVTMPLSAHATTNLAVIQQFLAVTGAVEPVAEHAVRVELRRSG
jgi:RNA 3'-terminal phosphate cyclase